MTAFYALAIGLVTMMAFLIVRIILHAVELALDLGSFLLRRWRRRDSIRRRK